jgi:hypothetical protein
MTLRAAALHRAWLAAGKPLPGKNDMPVILSGKITPASVDVAKAPGQESIAVKYKAPEGLNSILATFCTTTEATQCIQTGGYAYGAANATSGSATFESFDESFGGALNLYSAPGTWTLTDVQIYDQAGDLTDYSTPSELGALFPALTFSVTNKGTPDTVPPVVTAGEILTPTMDDIAGQLYFSAQLTATDNLSGASYATITLQPPEGSPIPLYGFTSAPLKSGTIQIAELFVADVSSTQTWAIAAYSVCDVANNCKTDTNPSDILALFGTNTVQVVVE